MGPLPGTLPLSRDQVDTLCMFIKTVLSLWLAWSRVAFLLVLFAAYLSRCLVSASLLC